MNDVDIPNKEELIRVMRKNHIVFAAIFGSRAKGTARPNSDYDFLVEFDPKYPIPFSRFFRVNEKLEETLKAEVDLITTRGTNKRLHEEIEKTKVVLYDERTKMR